MSIYEDVRNEVIKTLKEYDESMEEFTNNLFKEVEKMIKRKEGSK